jgi:hypothetical protein
MAHLFRPLVLAAFAMLTLVAPALAQTPDASPESTPVQGELAGLQDAVVRQYTTDPTLIPSENPDEFAVISVHLFHFDTADHAAAAWQSLRDNGLDQFQPAADAGEIEINEQELDDAGDQAYVVWLSAEIEEGNTGYYRALYVQDGELLYLLTAIAGNEQNTLVTEDIARVLIEREAGPGDVSFNPNGTSTGGLWDILPKEGDDVLQGLVPIEDREVAIP